jgi:hypothetical protein
MTEDSEIRVVDRRTWRRESPGPAEDELSRALENYPFAAAQLRWADVVDLDAYPERSGF